MPSAADIYAMIKPAQALADPLEQYGRMISIKSLMGNEALNELQRTKLTRDMQEEENFRNLFAGATPESMSAPDFLQRAMAASPTRGITLQKSLLDQEKTRADLAKTKIETHGAQVKQLRDQLAAVNDDAALTALREQAMKLYGPDVVAKMPATVSDPNFAEWRRGQLMTADKLVEQVNKDRDFTASQARDKETARHHGATERQASATLTETKKYHDAMIGTPVDPSDPNFNQQIDYWATVVKNGGALPPGLARGPGGGAFVREVTKRAAMGNVSPEDMMANQARFTGEKAGQRTLGTRTANIEMAATEAASLAQLAKEASGKVDRTQYKAFNQVMQAGQAATASPELRAFTASNTSLINAYARAINPQGVGTVADKEHAREMLSTAFSKGDYEAAVNQLLLEIDAARKSPGTVQKEMRDRFTGKTAQEASPAGTSQETRSSAPGKPSGGIKFLGWE